ncbi:hypothetical protein ACFOMD_08535 [Sphingoaurantiacus capsulatus]|uniref:Uncharacterized protein n=1 Tax=Sphingoaurantiacus capsulatus TaxID=1771310 RepID=A0ABV7XBE6_9SPHN
MTPAERWRRAAVAQGKENRLMLRAIGCFVVLVIVVALAIVFGLLDLIF